MCAHNKDNTEMNSDSSTPSGCFSSLFFFESFSLQASLQLNCISTMTRGGLCNGNQWAIHYFARNLFSDIFLQPFILSAIFLSLFHSFSPFYIWIKHYKKISNCIHNLLCVCAVLNVRMFKINWRFMKILLKITKNRKQWFFVY